jgi:glutamine cyclotransferase-related protein
VWAAAAAVGADNLFVQDDGTMVEDDHIPMNQIAGIPTIDIIPNTGTGFSETWHTTRDTPENISVDVLRGVGQTLIQFLHEENNRAK